MKALNSMIPEEEQLTEFSSLKESDLEFIRRLRCRGFAVIVWTPEEVGDHDLDDIEERSISFGYDNLGLKAGDNV